MSRNFSLTRGKAVPRERPPGALTSARQFSVYLRGEGRNLGVAMVAVAINAGIAVAVPYLIARAIDRHILRDDMSGLASIAYVLIGIYLVALVSSYLQAFLTGRISQRVLFRLRAAIFEKLQGLPQAFFTQNKAGDIMARINNDTEKINTFLGQGLGRFIGSFFRVVGIGVFIFTLNVRLSLVLVSSVLVILVATRLLTGWSSRLNKRGLEALGDLSSAIEDNLGNFKVIVAFGRRDYFRENIDQRNRRNFAATIRGVYSGQLFSPIYTASGNLAQLLVLLYGVHLIGQGDLSIGLLVGFVSYTQQFYNPLQEIGNSLGDIQTALAAWMRIGDLLRLESDLAVLPRSAGPGPADMALLRFDHVCFEYSPGREVLHDVSLTMERGKTYAIIGPTGGGKSTVASLMARLYDPIDGTITLDGRDLRTYTPAELASAIGFILQEPFLFTGTVGDNIRYGNPDIAELTDDQLARVLREANLTELLGRFDNGLATAVSAGSNDISLGQKQLISFVRAMLRGPRLLILDEATANIDTVTERLLTGVLDAMSHETTTVVIAHRLNTVASADEIIFIDGGRAQPALGFAEALALLDSTAKRS